MLSARRRALRVRASKRKRRFGCGAGGNQLFLPMALRGEVLGFLACGPKPDHTPYLPDEISALSLLAHHAGIASAWLTQPPAVPPLRIPVT